MTQFELRLTRFEGGKKGPVVMFHGAGVSSGIYSLDTIETNLVEFLVEHRYLKHIFNIKLTNCSGTLVPLSYRHSE